MTFQRRKKTFAEKSEFEQKLVEVKRVTRVTAGGKQLRFRSVVVIGNRKGKVGYGVAKGKDVADSVQKAVRRAEKRLISPLIVDETIPYPTKQHYKASYILLRPAKKGRGIIAGGVMKIVLDLLGLSNVTGKILGSKNKLNNIRATFKALEEFVQISTDKK